MPWELRVDPSVRKQLDRMPRKYAGRIMEAIQGFAVNPYAGDIEKMKGEKNVWRRRVGEYRVLYEVGITEKVVVVVDVRRRTSNTY